VHAWDPPPERPGQGSWGGAGQSHATPRPGPARPGTGVRDASDSACGWLVSSHGSVYSRARGRVRAGTCHVSARGPRRRATRCERRGVFLCGLKQPHRSPRQGNVDKRRRGDRGTAPRTVADGAPTPICRRRAASRSRSRDTGARPAACRLPICRALRRRKSPEAAASIRRPRRTRQRGPWRRAACKPAARGVDAVVWKRQILLRDIGKMRNWSAHTAKRRICPKTPQIYGCLTRHTAAIILFIS
jgi:hypothetical protein